MDNEKINGIPEEETEVQVNEAEETEEAVVDAEESTEEVNETAEDSAPENDGEDEESEGGESQEEVEEPELCVLCGERAVGEDSDYCPECEAEMLSRKIPFLGWIGGLAAVVMSVFALALAVLVAAPSIQVAKGDGFARNNCWYSAYKEYSAVSSVISELNSIMGAESPFIKSGTGLTYKLIDTVANSYSPLDAVSVANSILGQNSIDEHSALKKYQKVRDDYTLAYETLKPSIDAMSYGMAGKETTYESFERARSTEGINGIYIDYFLYNAALFFYDTTDVQLKYLEAVDKAAKESEEDYSWLYYQDYANALYESGDYDGAMEYVNLLTESDKTKFGAFELKLRIAVAKGDMDAATAVVEDFKEYNEGYDTCYVLEATLLRVTGKTEEAKILLNEAIEQYDSVPELHRQLALVYLLEDDYDNAYEAAYQADYNAYYLSYMGDNSAYTPQLTNTLYLCTYLEKEKGSGTTENATWIDSILQDFTEADLSEQVKAVVNGEKTVAEVLTEGAYDLA